MKKPKLLYLSAEDPLNKRSWSGIHYHQANQLSKYFDVTYAGPIKPSLLCFLIKAFNKIVNKLTGKTYNYDHSLLVGKQNIRTIKKLLANDYAVIFSCSSREIAALSTTIPIVYATDGTFDLVRNYYTEFSSLWKISAKESNQVEKKAIYRSSLLVFSSGWGARSAIETYKANEKKVNVLAFGANIGDPVEKKATAASSFSPFHILFIGVDWVRKGGDMVYKVGKLLKKMGFDIRLTIIGCEVPAQLKEENWIETIRSLNKNIPDELEKFKWYLNRSHLFFMPTKADCTPIVFCEAAAYSLPVISVDTGGVSHLVRNGYNGYCLPKKATENDYAACVSKLITDQALYNQFAENNRKLYEEEFNWDTWGEKLYQLIGDTIGLNDVQTSNAKKAALP